MSTTSASTPASLPLPSPSNPTNPDLSDTDLLSCHLYPLPAEPNVDGVSSRLHFGRIAKGIDLSRRFLSSKPALASEILNAVYEHGLIVFRDQSHLDPDDEVAFARLFTHQPADLDADANVSYTGGAGKQHRLPSHPSIAIVGSYSVKDFWGLTASSPGVYGNWHSDQRAWHCDGLADTHPPPDLTTMRCIKTPCRGGETLFASTVRAAELLPVRILVEKFGIHPEDVDVNYKLFGKYNISLDGTHLLEATGAKGDDAADDSGSSDGRGAGEVNLAGGTRVPLVIRERRTGKRSLVGSYHISSIVSRNRSRGAYSQEAPTRRKSLGFKQANAYLAEAWRAGLSEENVYKHKWEVGDLAAWSNRLMIHTATSTGSYVGEERLHTRIRMRSLNEDAPVAWNSVEDDVEEKTLRG